VLEDAHCLSFIRTHKDLLFYLLLDKAVEQFLKQKYDDELAASRTTEPSRLIPRCLRREWFIHDT
jgi:hypothetical protein